MNGDIQYTQQVNTVNLSEMQYIKRYNINSKYKTNIYFRSYLLSDNTLLNVLEKRGCELIVKSTDINWHNDGERWDTSSYIFINMVSQYILSIAGHCVSISSKNYENDLYEELITLDSNPSFRPSINVLVTNATNEICLKNVELDINYGESFILDNYNDDFVEVHEKIIKRINEKDSGLILLHGEPGTGKTSYIKYLMESTKQHLIYIPPDMAYNLTSPKFLEFMLGQQNSVLIIEDAENILKKRQAHDGQSVANLLNMTDGIMGNVLSCKIICTFNCHEDDIDEALMRKGRLIASYKFEKLNADKSLTLLQKNGHNVASCGDMTLAEIYNYEDQNRYTKIKGSFGFF